MTGTDDNKPDWLGMSDEEFKAHDEQRPASQRTGILSQYSATANGLRYQAEGRAHCPPLHVGKFGGAPKVRSDRPALHPRC